MGKAKLTVHTTDSVSPLLIEPFRYRIMRGTDAWSLCLEVNARRYEEGPGISNGSGGYKPLYQMMRAQISKSK